MCRPGSKMTFEESEEELNKLPGIKMQNRWRDYAFIMEKNWNK
jgi:hypothetical protein